MTEQEPKEYTATLTSDCVCEMYDEETDSTVLDEYGDPKRPEYCYGCYDEEVSQFYDNFLPMWLEQHNLTLDDELLVIATGIGWRRVTEAGTFYAKDTHKVLEINGDFRNVFTIKGDELYAIRYSHDEPVGSGKWSFSKAAKCDKCETPMLPDVHAEELGMCVECSNKYFDHEHPEHECLTC
jgi:hypothetical protein